MAPVFSKAAWRCAWYMVQNDLIHAWGLDMKLGYCAQGDRTKKVGVVDAEYITHLAVPSLGGNSDVETASSSSLDQSLIIDPLFAILIYFYYLGANGLSVWLVLCR
uniref:Uncharacterized protein n=1 Tax=Solanum tuberosum TaxID=4113 RepID=M1CBQ4_SOLTU